MDMYLEYIEINSTEMSHRQGEVVNEQEGHLYQASVAKTGTKPTTANILSDAIETTEKPQNVPMTTTPSPLTASGQGTEDSSNVIATTTPIMVDTSVAKPFKPEEKPDSENSTSLPSSIDLNQFDFSSDDAQNGKERLIKIHSLPLVINHARLSVHQVISIICSVPFNLSDVSCIINGQIRV